MAACFNMEIESGYGPAFKKQSASLGPTLSFKAFFKITSNSRNSPVAAAAPFAKYNKSFAVRVFLSKVYFALLFNLYILFIFYLEIY